MSEIVIEDGVPLPASRLLTTRHWPLAEMRAGQSFLIPNTKGRRPSGAAKTVKTWAEGHPGFVFTVHSTEAGIRVWCLKAPSADVPRTGDEFAARVLQAAAKAPAKRGRPARATERPPAETSRNASARTVRGTRY